MQSFTTRSYQFRRRIKNHLLIKTHQSLGLNEMLSTKLKLFIEGVFPADANAKQYS